MNIILMLTDFSENANHAAKTAAKALRNLNADILLYNTYYDHPILPTYAGGPWVVEEFVFRKDESEVRLGQLASQLRHIIADLTIEGVEPKIDYQIGEGSLGRNTAAVIQDNNIDLVVIGSSTDSSLDHLIFGRDTMQVIDHLVPPRIDHPAKSGFSPA
ncbi:universal stress protein [Mucilaginibacter sp. P19]|uniref:universal stress protein n=1 Tax=Mucilaginibacter sp. P19 TaxID=3423947 RepID=UPI003D671C3F